jgi:hypothetical protein
MSTLLPLLCALRRKHEVCHVLHLQQILGNPLDRKQSYACANPFPSDRFSASMLIMILTLIMFPNGELAIAVTSQLGRSSSTVPFLKYFTRNKTLKVLGLRNAPLSTESVKNLFLSGILRSLIPAGPLNNSVCSKLG